LFKIIYTTKNLKKIKQKTRNKNIFSWFTDKIYNKIFMSIILYGSDDGIKILKKKLAILIVDM